MDLEGVDSDLIILDLVGPAKMRIINLYRSFSPQNGVHQRDKFIYKLQLMKTAMTEATILLGDFNLNWSKRFHLSYAYKNYFEDMELAIGDHDMIRMLEQPTWMRTVDGQVRESTIYHLYIKNPLAISELVQSWQFFTDHSLILFKIGQDKLADHTTWRRDLRKYSREDLLERLRSLNRSFNSDLVRDYWNELENQ